MSNSVTVKLKHVATGAQCISSVYKKYNKSGDHEYATPEGWAVESEISTDAERVLEEDLLR